MTKQDALSFLLAHIVIEKNHHFELNSVSLFNLMTLASEAEQTISTSKGIIPHEVLEELAAGFVAEDT